MIAKGQAYGVGLGGWLMAIAEHVVDQQVIL